MSLVVGGPGRPGATGPQGPQGLPGGTIDVDTIADLTALPSSGLTYGTTAVVGRYGGTVDPIFDDGGGLFVFVPSSLADPNGGTIFRPDDVAPSGYGRWFRQFEGSEFNVKWFGAEGKSANYTDGEAIKACVDAVAANLGGTVYIPIGTYNSKISIVIPKLYGATQVPIHIRGAGSAYPYNSTGASPNVKNGSCIVGCSSVPGATLGTEGVIRHEMNLEPSLNFRMTDITIFRGDGGIDTAGGRCYESGYDHDYPGLLGGRLKNAIFENCQFFSNTFTVPAAEINGGSNIVIRNCLFNGGNYNLYMKNSSRSMIDNIANIVKNGNNHGFYLELCGTTTMRAIRTEGCKPGYKCLQIVNCQNTDITVFSTEGDGQDVSLLLKNSSSVSINQASIGYVLNGTAVKIENCSTVRLNGINCLGYSSGSPPSMYSLDVDASCAHVEGTINILDGAQGAISIASGAVDICFRVTEHWTSPFYSYTIQQGIVDPIAITTNTVLYRGGVNYANRGILQGSGTIHGIDQGDEGERITLLITGSSTIGHNKGSLHARGKPMLLSGSADLSCGSGSSISFVYYNNYWRETGRSVA